MESKRFHRVGIRVATKALLHYCKLTEAVNVHNLGEWGAGIDESSFVALIYHRRINGI